MYHVVEQSEKRMVQTGGESTGERKRSADGNGHDEPQTKRSSRGTLSVIIVLITCILISMIWCNSLL